MQFDWQKGHLRLDPSWRQGGSTQAPALLPASARGPNTPDGVPESFGVHPEGGSLKKKPLSLWLAPAPSTKKNTQPRAFLFLLIGVVVFFSTYT